MRPEVLFPLFAPVTSLPGVGPKIAAALERLAGDRVIDLLWHLPTGVIHRPPTAAIRAARPGTVATLSVCIDAHQPPSAARQPYRVRCSDATGILDLVFFQSRGTYLVRALPVGSVRFVSGMVDVFANKLQMTHPDYIVAQHDAAAIPRFEPVYALTAGLTPLTLGRLANAVLARAPVLGEWLDPAMRRQRHWNSWREALEEAHHPETSAAASAEAKARARLAYDELLATQLAVALSRAYRRSSGARSICNEGRLADAALSALGFRLTEPQTKVIREITTDMAAPRRMLRLLQGDVGSGKTVVALVAMLTAVESGCQAALMAPTEVLAHQHLKTIAPMAAAAGIKVAVLTGRDKGPARRAIYEGLAAGDLPLVIGTHALLEQDLAFNDLALAVIDEQHRFGVHQRLGLAGKGREVDVLVMTATPIPRTLMLTAYGDMDVSSLTTKPSGRRPIDTRVIPAERLEEVIRAINERLDDKAKIFWVCPLVEESSQLDLAAAENRYRHLRTIFGDTVGLMHGRLKNHEKDAVMQAFVTGKLRILVATTVIEVGVDVPDASLIVIEHADRFGLAQLHQLRGRVGRNTREATCILLYDTPLADIARARLSILRETEDGFRIAEEDLRLRGAGELLGTRQSGTPSYRLADPAAHHELLDVARDDVRLIMANDPMLESTRGHALRILLYLFERDTALRYLHSG